MKSHYCKSEKTVIDFEGECNWCGEKEMAQHKDEKPQYLYVYGDVQWDLYSYKLTRRKGDFGTYIGKIKLEVDDVGSA